MKLTNSLKAIGGVLAVAMLAAMGFALSPSSAQAQDYKVIHGYYGEDENGDRNATTNSFPSPISTYTYIGGYPNYGYQYAYYWDGYYYYNRGYQEFSVRADEASGS